MGFKSQNKGRDRAAQKIRVTPEMVRAAVAALDAYRDDAGVIWVGEVDQAVEACLLAALKHDTAKSRKNN